MDHSLPSFFLSPLAPCLLASCGIRLGTTCPRLFLEIADVKRLSSYILRSIRSLSLGFRFWEKCSSLIIKTYVFTPLTNNHYIISYKRYSIFQVYFQANWHFKNWSADSVSKRPLRNHSEASSPQATCVRTGLAASSSNLTDSDWYYLALCLILV